ADQLCRISTQAESTAEIAISRALGLFIALHPFGHDADDWLLGRTEFGRGSILDSSRVTGGLDAGHLHAEADTEIRHVLGAGEASRFYLACRTALTTATWHQNAVHMLEIWRRIVTFEDFRVDPLQVDLHLVGDATMDQGFRERL